jgi:lysophospholipase L1-like esterase
MKIWTLTLLALTCGLARLAHSADTAGADTFYLQKGDVVLFLGDSITEESKYMYQLYYDDIAKKYPDLLGGPPPAYNHDAFKAPSLTFVNGGVSGDTAGGGVNRLPALIQKWKPTVCVVCFGMNDRYKDRANYVENMRKIVKKLKESNIAVTILTAPSTYPVNDDLKKYIPILGEMAGEMKQLAADEKVLYADCYSKFKAWIDAGKANFTWGDGIHPNTDGHRMMNDALEQVWNYGKPLAAAGAPRFAPAASITAKK